MSKLRRVAKQPRKGGIETRNAALQVILEHPDISRRRCAEKVATIRHLKDEKGVERTIRDLFEKDEHGKTRPTREARRAAEAVGQQKNLGD